MYCRLSRATSPAVAETSRRQRNKEGRYASELHAGLEGGEDVFLELSEVSDASGRREMRTAGLIARSSLLIHIFLGGAVALGLWISVAEIRFGAMKPGDLFLFVAYNYDSSMPLVFWFAQLTVLDMAAALYCVAVEEENISLVPYAIFYRLFFALTIDFAKVFATFEELLRLRMEWGKLQRMGRI